MRTPTICHPTGRPNYAHVEANGIRYAFSYATCIGAQSLSSGKRITRENVWGPTTGKHLNDWDGGYKHLRLSAEDFRVALIIMESGR